MASGNCTSRTLAWRESPIASDQRWYSIACILLLLGSLVLWLHDASSRVQHVAQEAKLLLAQPIESAQDHYQPAPVETPLHSCDFESGPASSRHEDWVNRLDGRRIVFIGDSITRYQHLELSYYLAHGLCPCVNSSEYGYIMREQYYHSWEEFYRNTSPAVSVTSDVIKTRELCLCNRPKGKLTVSTNMEHRHYVYEDVQGRRIEFVYIQYFNEQFDPFKKVMQSADAAQPTDVLVNFGHWMRTTYSSCGSKDGQGDCPYIPWVCKYFETKRPYRKFWQSTTLVTHKQTTKDEVPESHHLHIPSRCNLASAQVLDRGKVMKTIQPDASLRYKLFYNQKHIHSEANHAFNMELLNHMPKKAAGTCKSSQNRESNYSWMQMFGA